MAINDDSAFAGPYTGNGVTTVFPFDFAIFDPSEVAVGVNGIAQLAGFSVISTADVNGSPTGGTVTFAVAPAIGALIIVASDPDFTQSTMFDRFGPYYPDFTNRPFDQAAIKSIYLKDKTDRAILVPPGETGFELPGTIDANALGILAGIAPAISTVAANEDNINTVADDLNGPDTIGAALAAAAAAAISANYAEEFSGGIAYATRALGEALTLSGHFFRVNIGTVPETYTRWQRTDSGSIQVASLATTLDLASATSGKGADLIGGLSNARTLAEAKALTLTGERITLSDRAFSTWIPWNVLIAKPTETQDLTWFQHQGGAYVLEPFKSIDPRFFGAVGNDVNLDTFAFTAMFWWVSKGYSHSIVIHNIGNPYLIKTGLYSYLPNDAVRAAILAMQGNNGSSLVLGLSGVNINGLSIIGEGKPIIKLADNSCTTDTTSLMSRGLLNFHNCHDVMIRGVEVDNNRLGQTSGAVFNKTNHGIVLWPTCSDFTIWNITMRNTGTATDNADKSGDAIYMRNGVSNIDIGFNKFFDRGRMDVTLERSWDITYTLAASNIRVHHNYSQAPLKQDGGVSYAFMDIESWSGFDGVYIHDNVIKGQARISVSPAVNVNTEQFMNKLYIQRNTFDLTGSTNPHDLTFIISIGCSAGWTNPSIPLASIQGTYVGSCVEDNIIVTDQPLPNAAINLQYACFRDLSLGRNKVIRTDNGGTLAAFVQQNDCAFEGELKIEDNDANGFVYGFYLLSGFHTLTKRTQLPVKITMRRNTTRGGWGIRGLLPAMPAGSSILLEGNRFDQTSQSNFDVSAFAAVTGNKAILRDSNFFSGLGNVLTGFTTAGVGSSVIASGAAFVDVTHGCTGPPANIVLGARDATVPYVDGAPGNSTFRIRVPSAVGANTTVYWRAENSNGF